VVKELRVVSSISWGESKSSTVASSTDGVGHISSKANIPNLSSINGGISRHQPDLPVLVLVSERRSWFWHGR
jgi:hypothetical protein